jgi:prolyl oligopeptidase
MKTRIKLLAACLLLIGAHSAMAQSDDKHQWLEDVGGDKALDWVKARNQETRQKLDNDAGFLKLRSDLQVILDSKDRIPGIQKIGNAVYNFWMDAEHPRGVWRKTSMTEYRKPQPKWETVLDIDAIAKAENENWVFKGSQCREPEYDRCIINLSRGGADAVTIREFDLKTMQFVKDGFALPEAKMNVSWRDKNTLFIGTDFGAGSLTDSGYPRIVKEWTRGTPISTAKTIFEGQKEDISVSAGRSSHRGITHEIVNRAVTFYTSEVFLMRGSKLQKLDIPAQTGYEFFGKQFIVTPNEAWTTGGKTYP